MVWPNRGLTHRAMSVGTRGMVASAHQLASLAGLRMLMAGGNAIDAAIATAAALSTTEPYMSGMAGVGTMTIFDAASRTVRILDFAGTTPQNASPSAFKSRDEQEHGPKSPMVPGACGGWLTALETLGTLDASTVFAPAIEYAEVGVPLTVKNEYFLRNSLLGGHIDRATMEVFYPGGIVPPAGTILKQPKLAATFRTIANEGQDAFYRGAVGREIVRVVQEQGGLLTEADLAAFEPRWQEPVSADYRGHNIWCAPPPGAGIQYLQTLKLLEAWDIAEMGQGSDALIHLTIEAMKLATADRIAYASLAEDCPVETLLSDDYLAGRRKLIDPNHAKPSEGERWDGHVVQPETISAGNVRGTAALPESTTHFSVIDGDGNGVAVTQSLGDGFGSGVMAGSTGLVLNNFNYWFDSDLESPNVIGPGKRIEMCMSPAAITREDGALFAVMGTPGSHGILETTPQMMINLIDFGFSMQAAIEAPRFRTYSGTTVEMEARFPKQVRDDLIKRGHVVQVIDDWSYLVGGGHGVMIDPGSGALLGGADPRRDGFALGY